MENPAPEGVAALPRSLVGHCLYCGERSFNELIEGVEDFYFGNVAGNFTLRRCAHCRSLWLADPLSADALPQAYARYYTHEDIDNAPGESGGVRGWIRHGHIARRYGGSHRLGALVGHVLYTRLAPDRQALDARYRFAPPAPARLLDYGCGGGDYLRQMRDLGYEVTGVEQDPECVARLEAHDIPLHQPGEIEAGKLSEWFDFVTLNHVIEHLPEPGAVLQRIASWMKPGARLFIETPNAEAEGLERFGRYWRGLEAPRHLSVPSMAGLRRVLEQAGLQVERQVVRRSIRRWLWQETLAAIPKEASNAHLCEQGAEQTTANAEFITLIARKPA